MSVETDVRAYLLADATVAGLIGTRMYPLILPQSPTYPAVSYSTISATRGHHNAGPDGLPAQRVQIDAWAITFGQARALADAIRRRIDGLRETIGSTVVQGVFFDGERHSHETVEPNASVYRISQDFICWFEE